MEQNGFEKKLYTIVLVMEQNNKFHFKITCLAFKLCNTTRWCKIHKMCHREQTYLHSAHYFSASSPSRHLFPSNH